MELMENRMKLSNTILKGSYVIELEKIEDERGFLQDLGIKKLFQKKEFQKLILI